MNVGRVRVWASLLRWNSRTPARTVLGTARSVCTRLNRYLVFGLRCTGMALFTVYLGWNAWWICHAAGPPSLLLAITGLPAPTTGGTRSFVHLCAGNWTESLRYNAMTIPIALLLATTLVQLAWQGWRGRRWALPTWMTWSWALVLGAAWVLKLCGDPRYW